MLKCLTENSSDLVKSRVSFAANFQVFITTNRPIYRL